MASLRRRVEHDAAHIARLDLDGLPVEHLRVDASILPALLQAVEVHPIHAAIERCFGLDVNFIRKQLAPLRDSFFDPGLHFFDRLGMILVAHAGADEVRRLEAFFREHFHHVFGAVALRILLAAVADERHIEKIARVVRHVVKAPQHLLIPHGILVGRELLVALHIGEAGTGMHAGPLIWIMRTEMPCACAAHAEAGDGNAI